MQVQTTQQPQERQATSEAVIPSVRGEFYRYNAEFSPERPLAYLMKCKANKDRVLSFAEDHADELDLTFVFERGVQICSPNAAPSVRLLGDLIGDQELNQTLLAPAGITAEVFELVRVQKDESMLAQICRASLVHNQAVMELTPGVILAVITQSGKYGLLLVKEITPSSVKVDACHILL